MPAFDATRQVVVVYGGMHFLTAFTDTWEWDGTAWTYRSAGSPAARNTPAMAYDAVRGGVLLFGGQDGNVAREPRNWRYGAFSPAVAATSGTACAGTHGAPAITSGVPFLGNPDLALDLVAANGMAPCLFGLSATRQDLPLGGGCSLYLSTPIFALPTVSNAYGFASIRVAIPNDPGLRGGVLHAQGIVADPLGGFAGLAFSASLQLQFGE